MQTLVVFHPKWIPNLSHHHHHSAWKWFLSDLCYYAIKLFAKQIVNVKYKAAFRCVYTTKVYLKIERSCIRHSRPTLHTYNPVTHNSCFGWQVFTHTYKLIMYYAHVDFWWFPPFTIFLWFIKTGTLKVFKSLHFHSPKMPVM